MTGDQIVDAVISQGSFDVSSSGVARTDVEGWCIEVYATLVAEAGWLRAIKTFATTVVDQSDYDWPASVVAAVELRDQAARRYLPVTVDQMWDLQGGVDLMLAVGAPAVYAVVYDDTGETRQMRIYPTPDTAGLTLEGVCNLYPTEFNDDAAFALVTPPDFDGAIIDGAIRLGRRRVDEVDAPVVVDDLLQAEIMRLRMRKAMEVPPPKTLPVRRR
jgi:hypothetical protein